MFQVSSWITTVPERASGGADQRINREAVLIWLAELVVVIVKCVGSGTLAT
jgi:hypothetical protein